LNEDIVPNPTTLLYLNSLRVMTNTNLKNPTKQQDIAIRETGNKLKADVKYGTCLWNTKDIRDVL
jgi:hypothetical protein